jgi:SH3-like domain-containing protein
MRLTALPIIIALMTTGLAVLADSATVKGDRVNIRARAAGDAEILGWVKRGDTVTVLGRESANWTRVALPSKIAVWIYGPLVDPTKTMVKAQSLKVRLGPGRNYSEIGELKRGGRVSVIREMDGWFQIETPSTLSGFIASNLLGDAAEPAATPPPAVKSFAELPQRPPLTRPVRPGATLPLEAELQPVAPQPTRIPETSLAPAFTPAPVEPAVVPSTPPTSGTQIPATISAAPAQTTITYTSEVRRVTREGMIVWSFDPHSPSYYQLKSLRGEGRLGYLVTQGDGIKLKKFTDRRVMVVADEYIDPARPATPVLIVQSVELLYGY